MRDILKLVLKYIMRFFLHIYWFLPVDNRKIFFMSTMGKSYSCNPKYLYKSMVNDPKFKHNKFVWAFIEPSKWEDDFIQYNNTKLIKKKNYISYFFHLLTSKVVIYNCGGFSYAPIRKKQLLIETWHGAGAFKNVGITVEGKSNASKKGIKIASKEIKLFLSSCRLQTENLIRKSMNYKGKVLDSGFPRNDILISPNNDLITEIKEKLNVDNDTKIILYAPTFKGSEHKATNINNEFEIINPAIVKEALQDKFGGDWKFYTRGHQYANQIELEGIDGDWSFYPDMQELLLISDVLITDYSSSIWDFALTNKMCILFAPDFKNYENNERGFFTPFIDWPGIHIYSNQEIEEKISSYNENEYILKAKRYINYCESYDKGHACEKVKEYIFKEMN